jgi:hypothetical protein
MVRLPEGQGEEVQQAPVLPDGQHETVPQQELFGQHWEEGQQIGITSALLGGLPVGTGQHGTSPGRWSGHTMRAERAAVATPAVPNHTAVAARRNESETSKRRIAGRCVPEWTAKA